MNNMSIQFKGLQSSDVQQKDNPGFFKKSGAGLAGYTVAGIGTAAVQAPILSVIKNKFIKFHSGVTKDEIQILNKVGEKVLNDSGLQKKGVKLLREVPEQIALSINPLVQEVKKGINAMYIYDKKMAVVPNKLAASQFHELGHAMNANGRWGKLLLNLRHDYSPKALKIAGIKIPFVRVAMALAVSTVPLVGIFKNKKAEGEQAVGFWDKTTTFIKNNVGKLTFIAMLPMVAEEALASFKGEKAVKGLINADLFKKVKLSNRLALATYAVMAAFAGFGAMCAVKIRDKIAQPNLNKA